MPNCQNTHFYSAMLRRVRLGEDVCRLTVRPSVCNVQIYRDHRG